MKGMIRIAHEHAAATRKQSVSAIQPATEIVVFYPASALMLDLANWFGRHSRFNMRAVESHQVNNIRAASQRAALAIVDATEALNAAMTALGLCLENLPPEKIVVYTERMHDGLEIFVRSRRVLLMLGPASQTEWEAFLAPLESRINMAI